MKEESIFLKIDLKLQLREKTGDVEFIHYRELSKEIGDEQLFNEISEAVERSFLRNNPESIY